MERDKELTDRAKALLRYRVVSLVRAMILGGTKRPRAITAVADQVHFDDEGNARRFSRRTVKRWFGAYEKEGVTGLEDKPRDRCESSVVLKPALLTYLEEQKEKDRPASIPELLRRARLAGVLHPTQPVDRTTVWRALQRMGISTRRVRKVEVDDKRRFAFPERMQMVLVDYKHFRVGPTRARRVAIYFLDDATRYGLGVYVGTHGEKALYTLRGLYEVVKAYGAMSALYLDNGAGFRADDVHTVASRLDIPVIHGRARYPQGHGKIERFNGALKARLLRNYDTANWVETDPAALTLRLRHDLFEVYNHLKHEGLENDTPWQRWQKSKHALRPVAAGEELRQRFMVDMYRRVSNDHCIKFRRVAYEVPMGLAGRRIVVERALLEDDALYFRHAGKRIRLHPVDLELNARSRRARATKEDDEPDGSPVKNASSLAFEAEYGSILDSDGGFSQEEDADSYTPNQEEDDGEDQS